MPSFSSSMDKARDIAAPPSAAAKPQMIPRREPAAQVSRDAKPTPLAVSVPGKVRNSVLTPDAFSTSLVTENGSYEFDRVLKSGYVRKRTRKTKSWKSIYLVLRPTSISIYKDQDEAKLRHKIDLADLTAVAFLKDPKHKRQNVFGLFSPSRNYHLEALSKTDAEEWVGLIRREARIEEEEEEMFLASPSANMINNYAGLDEEMRKRLRETKLDEHRGSSSPEPTEPLARAKGGTQPDSVPVRRASHFDYSGNEPASHSDLSDVEMHFHHRPKAASRVSIPELTEVPGPSTTAPRPIIGARNASQMSGFNAEQDPERVVWQGHLLYLKSKSGVRQWKDLWCVLRVRSFALYKDENEYAPLLILELGAIINVVEIDPVSKTKVHCLQIITEERSYRFCARSEEGLDLALGGFKSLLAKRKESDIRGPG